MEWSTKPQPAKMDVAMVTSRKPAKLALNLFKGATGVENAIFIINTFVRTFGQTLIIEGAVPVGHAL